MLRRARLLAVTLCALTLGACGAKHQVVPDAADVRDQPADGWPIALPVDHVQPWESVASRGYVMPAGGARQASALSEERVFLPGVEREAQSARGVDDNGEAARFTTGAAGRGAVSWAFWRLIMEGEQPGMVSAYVNLRPMSDWRLSSYYIGLADYAAGAWEWHGPFTDSHVRVTKAESVAGGSDYLSPLGNLFVCLVACDGATFDVVALGAEPVYTIDGTPPPAPEGLTVTPVAGGVELRWLGVAAGDLAGYRVYYRGRWFLDVQAPGLEQVEYLVRGTRYVLSGLDGETFVRVAAVDVSGNESELSSLVSAVPFEGEPPELVLFAAAPSGPLNEAITLAAVGAETYDWDLDGDGEYEVTGDATGTRQANTSATGLTHAAVRGTTGAGVALRSVGLIVAANARPVATAAADPRSGTAPLTVIFTGTAVDPDGTIVSYSWDFEGDGVYDFISVVAPSPPGREYTVGGLYNVKFRVEDDQGAWDVDSVAVQVRSGSEPPSQTPVAELTAERTKGYWPFTINFDAAGSYDPDGSIVLYEWDLNGDGVFEEYGPGATNLHTYSTLGWYRAQVRVTDDKGKQDTAQLDITLPSEWCMFGMSPSRNRRSPYVGAQTNHLKWSYRPEEPFTSSCPVIGPDGTIYLGCMSPGNKLYAINPDGSVRWTYLTGSAVRSPAIGVDGTIYVGSFDDNLYAINPDGSLKWSYLTEGYVFSCPSAPAIGADGTIYVVNRTQTYGHLYAINPDGSLKWSYDQHGVGGSPAIGADGTIYVANDYHDLGAVNPDGSLKWSCATEGSIGSSPAVGSDGTIYVATGQLRSGLWAVNPDGSLKWSYDTEGAVYSSPGIGADGTIYVGSSDHNLYAINPDGSLRWLYLTGNSVHSSPAIGADGTIYVGSLDGDVYAVNPTGSLKWSFPTAGSVHSSPAIGADGTVYVTSGFLDGRLLAFGAP